MGECGFALAPLPALRGVLQRRQRRLGRCRATRFLSEARPAELVGQDAAFDHLETLLDENWSGNFVFTGPAGVGRRRVARWVGHRLAAGGKELHWVTTSVEESEAALKNAESLDTNTLEWGGPDEDQLLDRLKRAEKGATDPKNVFVVDIDGLRNNDQISRVVSNCLPLKATERAQWILLVSEIELKQKFPRACKQVTKFVDFRPLTNSEMAHVLQAEIGRLETPPALGNVMDAALAFGRGSPGDALGKIRVFLHPDGGKDVLNMDQLLRFLRSLSSAEVRALRGTQRATLVSNILSYSQDVASIRDISWHTYVFEYLAEVYYESFVPAMEQETRDPDSKTTVTDFAFGVNLTIAQAHESLIAGVEPQLVWNVALLKIVGLLPAAPRKLRHNSRYQF